MKTCYQCDKEVEWLAPDSRCGDCTRLTPEQIIGEELMPDEAEQELDAFFKRYGLCEQAVEGIYRVAALYRGCAFQVDLIEGEEHTTHKFSVNDVVLVDINVSEDKQTIEFINAAEKAIKTQVDFGTPLFNLLSTMAVNQAIGHLQSLGVTIMDSRTTGPDWFVTYSYQGLWSIGPGAVDYD